MRRNSDGLARLTQAGKVMSPNCDRAAFLAHAERVLEPHGLLPLAQCVLAAVDRGSSRLAYFHNPHIVFTRAGPAQTSAKSGLLDALQAWAADLAATLELAPLTSAATAQTWSGVPDGDSVHDEIYFDHPSASGGGLLHGAGMGFRVRITSSSDPAGASATRVLLILTRYPVHAEALQPLRPDRCWATIDTNAFPASADVLGNRDALAVSTSLPTIADCFVIHLDEVIDAATVFESLYAEALPVRAIARMHKTSRKFAIRPWLQNPVSGLMQPDWAYATLDRIEATLLVGTDSTVPAQTLSQIEIEIGPSSVMIAAALARIEALDRVLAQHAPDFAPVFGRKIHRLLESRGGAIVASGPYM